MIFTVVLSLCAGLAFRKFRGSVCCSPTIASLIIPSIAISLGIALQFRLLDDDKGSVRLLRSSGSLMMTSMGLIASGLGTHLTWTLPFGLLIMFAVFNRFNPSYEEAAGTWCNSVANLLGCCFPVNSSRPCGCRVVRIHAQPRRARALVAGFGLVNTLPLELRGLTTTVTNPRYTR